MGLARINFEIQNDNVLAAAAAAKRMRFEWKTPCNRRFDLQHACFARLDRKELVIPVQMQFGRLIDREFKLDGFPLRDSNDVLPRLDLAILDHDRLVDCLGRMQCLLPQGIAGSQRDARGQASPAKPPLTSSP